jgi:hypothetical protein
VSNEEQECSYDLPSFASNTLDTITKKVGSTHNQSKCKSVANGETCGTM